MTIWVDADACPGPIKEILYRAAQRKEICTVLVANQSLYVPRSPFIKMVQVRQGIDVADHYIVQHIVAHDLVITADIPLADAVIEKNAYALNPRGEFYTQENIKQRLSIRNHNDAMRGMGLETRGPRALNKKDLQQFANHLDRFLAHLR